MTNYTKYILNFAKEILSIPSPSGYTKEVINHIQLKTNELGYSNYKTKKENLIIEIPGTTDKVLGLSGHLLYLN